MLSPLKVRPASPSQPLLLDHWAPSFTPLSFDPTQFSFPKCLSPTCPPDNSSPAFLLGWRGEWEIPMTRQAGRPWRSRCHFWCLPTAPCSPNKQWHRHSLSEHLAQVGGRPFWSPNCRLSESFQSHIYSFCLLHSRGWALGLQESGDSIMFWGTFWCRRQTHSKEQHDAWCICSETQKTILPRKGQGYILGNRGGEVWGKSWKVNLGISDFLETCSQVREVWGVKASTPEALSLTILKVSAPQLEGSIIWLFATSRSVRLFACLFVISLPPVTVCIPRQGHFTLVYCGVSSVQPAPE